MVFELEWILLLCPDARSCLIVVFVTATGHVVFYLLRHLSLKLIRMELRFLRASGGDLFLLTIEAGRSSLL